MSSVVGSSPVKNKLEFHELILLKNQMSLDAKWLGMVEEIHCQHYRLHDIDYRGMQTHHPEA